MRSSDAVRVTIWVYSADARGVRGHEYLGSSDAYLGAVRIPRRRLPRARAGERVELLVRRPVPQR